MPALFIIKPMLVNRYTEDKMLVIMFREGSDEAFNEIVRRHYEKLLRLLSFSLQETAAAGQAACRIFTLCYFDKSDFLAGTGALNAVYAFAWRNLSQVSVPSRDSTPALCAPPCPVRQDGIPTAAGPGVVPLLFPLKKGGQGVIFPGTPGLEDSIKSAVSKLPLKMRFLMYLLFYEKMDYAAVSEITGISAGKIGRKQTWIICRIKNELDGILEKIVEESGLPQQQAQN